MFIQNIVDVIFLYREGMGCDKGKKLERGPFPTDMDERVEVMGVV